MLNKLDLKYIWSNLKRYLEANNAPLTLGNK